MGPIESLATLLSALTPDVDITFGDDVDITHGDDIDIEDIQEDCEVQIKSGSEGEKAHVTKETIYLYPEQLQGEEYVTFQQLVRKTKKSEGEVVRVDEKEETRALESVDKSEIDKIVHFFDGLISNRHISILKSSLYLRMLSETDDHTSDFDVSQKKREIAEKYGYESYYMIHLVSSGYFDEDRYFQQLYHEMKAESANISDQYREEFEKIIGEKLIATFVNADDKTYEVESDIKRGIDKYFRYRPSTNFFDVCGMGRQCEITINEAIEEIEQKYELMEYENKDRGEERVRRIFPETIENFGIK